MSQQIEGEGEGRTAAEVARADIDKVLTRFGTLNPGSELDGAAQLVLQSLQVLGNRVDKPRVLKLLYVDNPEASKMLPDLAMRTVEGLTEGHITPNEARDTLESAIPDYIKAFEELGVTPQQSWVVYSRDR